MRSRTASHDWILKWQTPLKERSVGQSANSAGGLPEVTLGHRLAPHLGSAVITRKGNAGDEGGKGSQGGDEGEDSHSVWLSGKERGGSRERGV